MKTPGAEMVVVAESERRETNGAITYFVTFKNNGPQWCYYNLQGGGAVWKVRIVTEGNNVVGHHPVENEALAPGQVRGGLIAGQGQRIQEAEVADDFALVPSPEEIHKRLAAHLTKKAAA
jgi:hypothetical protein